MLDGTGDIFCDCDCIDSGSVNDLGIFAVLTDGCTGSSDLDDNSGFVDSTGLVKCSD